MQNFNGISKSLGSGLHFLSASVAVFIMMYLVQFSVFAYNVGFNSSFGKLFISEMVNIASSSNFMAYTMLFVIFVIYSAIIIMPVALSIYIGNLVVYWMEKLYENFDCIEKFSKAMKTKQ